MFLVILFFLVPIAMLGFSFYLISFWKHFWKFFFVNLLVLIGYSIVIIFGILDFWVDTDPYGIAAMLLFLKTIFFHIILNFVASIIINYRLRHFKNSSGV